MFYFFQYIFWGGLEIIKKNTLHLRKQGCSCGVNYHLDLRKKSYDYFSVNFCTFYFPSNLGLTCTAGIISTLCEFESTFFTVCFSGIFPNDACILWPAEETKVHCYCNQETFIAWFAHTSNQLHSNCIMQESQSMRFSAFFSTSVLFVVITVECILWFRDDHVFTTEGLLCCVLFFSPWKEAASRTGKWLPKAPGDDVYQKCLLYYLQLVGNQMILVCLQNIMAFFNAIK